MGTEEIHSSYFKFNRKKLKFSKMGKEVAEKFEGKWLQTKTENIDAINIELGHSWFIRKTANIMDIRTKFTAEEEGLRIVTITKLKNFESFHPYTGKCTEKGINGEDVEKEIFFLEDGTMKVVEKGIKAGSKFVETEKIFSIVDGN